MAKTNIKAIQTLSKKSSTKAKKLKKGVLMTKEEALKYEKDNFGSLETSKGINALMRGNNFYKKSEIRLFDRFNRFGYFDPYNTLTGCREYLFFVKPDLHIFKDKNLSKLNPELGGGSVESDQEYRFVKDKAGKEKLEPVKETYAAMTIFTDAKKRYPSVLKQLQASATKSPFMKILSNTVSSSLDLPGISADTIETARNIYGSVITYRGNSIKSDTDFDFSLEFKDTKNLDVYMLFKLYDEYERKKFNGDITPPDDSYITNKILHDQMAIYKFIVADDGETILYWAKLTGVYPTSVPRDSFSTLEPGDIKFSVSFKCAFVEDMNPDILADFNRVVGAKKSNTLPVYNKTYDVVEGEWPVMPYIGYDTEKISGMYKKMPWKLKWRKWVKKDGDDNE